MSEDNKKINILLVEDSPLMRKMEKKTLESLGYENLAEADDGNAAIEKLESGFPADLVISDWNMPNRDGYELLVWIRSNEKFKHIPFLMATGQAEKSQVEKAKEAGVNSFISKPYNAEELRVKIEESLGLKKDEKDIPRQPEAPRHTSSGKVILRVAHIQITDHLTLGVLQSMINTGKLVPKHFELETRCLPGWNPVQQGLESGAVDAAFVLAPICMNMFGHGVPIKLVMFAHKNGSIFVRNKLGNYQEPYAEFFRGKTFLIPHMLSIHHMLAHMFFKKMGLNPGLAGQDGVDLFFEIVPPIAMPGALEGNPDICGYMVAEPLGTKAIAAGTAELQFLSGELWENHPCCILAMREEFVENYTDAVYEFTEMLVQAGKVIEQKPDTAAEIAVPFLDPNKQIGLKVPLIKNVLKEAQGIKTGDLFPVIEDLDKIQRYMVNEMGIGKIIDLDKFVDIRFAEQAFKNRAIGIKTSVLRDSESIVQNMLQKSAEKDVKTDKTMLNIEGKYLTFLLNDVEFGIDLVKVREIISMRHIRAMPDMPSYCKGFISLRGTILPVMDMRLIFGLPEQEYNKRTNIIILELEQKGKFNLIGVVVDLVLEVLDVTVNHIMDPPNFGSSVNTSHLLAIANIKDTVKLLLNIDNVVNFQGAEICSLEMKQLSM